jgi:hypothetical protein
VSSSVASGAFSVCSLPSHSVHAVAKKVDVVCASGAWRVKLIVVAVISVLVFVATFLFVVVAVAVVFAFVVVVFVVVVVVVVVVPLSRVRV